MPAGETCCRNLSRNMYMKHHPKATNRKFTNMHGIARLPMKKSYMCEYNSHILNIDASRPTALASGALATQHALHAANNNFISLSQPASSAWPGINEIAGLKATDNTHDVTTRPPKKTPCHQLHTNTQTPAFPQLLKSS